MFRNHRPRSLALLVTSLLLVSAGPAMAAGRFAPPPQVTATQSSHVQSPTLCSEVCGSALASSHAVLSHTYSRPDKQLLSPPTSPSTPTVAHVTTSSDGNGFDWGDAAIGAGAAIIVMLVIGGSFAASTRRTRPGLAA